MSALLFKWKETAERCQAGVVFWSYHCLSPLASLSHKISSPLWPGAVPSTCNPRDPAIHACQCRARAAHWTTHPDTRRGCFY